MKTWQQSLNFVVYRIEVDGEFYCDIGFPEDDTYATVIETCQFMVEGDEEYANRRVVNSFLDPEKSRLCFYTTAGKPPGDWWAV